jgi:hypothetical protein
MSLKTAIKEYGLLGIPRRIVYIIIGHDYGIGQACLYCDEKKPEYKYRICYDKDMWD